MRTSSSPSPEDKARRTAPRRHAQSPDQDLATKYDGGEYPVLIRMPDLTWNEATGIGSEVDPRPEDLGSQAVSEDVGSTSSRHRRHRRHSKSEPSMPEKGPTSAKASARFWGTLAPKLAVGGMLLVITVFCVVMFQKPGRHEPESDIPSGWAGPSQQPARATHDPAGEPKRDSFPLATQSDSASTDTSLAVKPEARPADAPTWGDSAVKGVEPATDPLEVGASSGQELGNAWPAETAADQDAGSDPKPETNKPYRADRWPDDFDLSGDKRGTEPQLELNAATKSAQRAVRPGMPTAKLYARAGRILNSQENSGGARLLGTVDIPNPRTEYR